MEEPARSQEMSTPGHHGLPGSGLFTPSLWIPKGRHLPMSSVSPGQLRMGMHLVGADETWGNVGATPFWSRKVRHSS